MMGWILSAALLLLMQGTARAEDFGERTPEVSELVDALTPARVKRGPVGVSGAAASNKGRASMQIGFEFGSSKVLDRDLQKLQRLAQALDSEGLRSARFVIVGHTDASGPLAVNMRLSRQRAESVVANLIAQGVESGRLSADGRGPNELLNKERPDASENRRVEISIVK
jgi:OOP family OmpA-OmpF porin